MSAPTVASKMMLSDVTNGSSERRFARDAAAFETLYESHYDLVYSISKRMLDDPVAAEDVVQSVFFSVWLRPEAFRGGSFTAWLTTVTKNRARDVLRTRSAYREIEIPPELADGNSFVDEVHGRIEIARIVYALATLPIAQRVLIERGFLAGCTHGELAKQTGLPLGTIKTRIRAGLQSLRKTLAA